MFILFFKISCLSSQIILQTGNMYYYYYCKGKHVLDKQLTDH